MVEVYSILNQAQSNDLWFVPIIFGVFGGAFFIFLFIRLIKLFTTHKVFIGKLLINLFALVFIVAWSILPIWMISEDKQMYADYREALESGSCLIESGAPEMLEVYRDRAGEADDYEITFYLNGKYFDSYLTYGECNFSRSDLRLIESSEIFEVKYIVDESNDNIILSLTVGKKTD